MNERIKELWEEATVSTWPRPGKFTAGEYDYHLEKFAELIVTECLMKVHGAKIRNESYTELIERFKEDFGVEL